MSNGLALLSEIAMSIIGTEDFSVLVESLLGIAGGYAGVSHVFVFLDDEDGLRARRDFLWSKNGPGAWGEKARELSYPRMPGWRKALEREGYLCAERVQDMSLDARAFFEPLGVGSLLVFALHQDKGVKGCLGFVEMGKERSWSGTELDLLHTVAGFVSMLYQREAEKRRFAHSEQNFIDFFQTVEDLIFVADARGAILHANRTACLRLGHSLDVLRERRLGDLFPPEDSVQAQAVLAAAARGIYRDEALEMLSGDRERVALEVRAWRGNWNGKEALFVIGKDVSQEREALLKFSSFFGRNPALMAIMDLNECVFTEVNEAFERMVGYRREEAIGKSMEDLRLFAEPERFQAIAQELRKKRHFENQELSLRRRDGHMVHGLFYGEVISCLGKAYFLLVMVDISETVQLRRKVDSQRERLDNILLAANLGTWEWNVQSGAAQFSERWAAMVGYTLAELQPIGFWTWQSLLHEEDKERCEEQLQRHFRQEMDFLDMEFRMRHKDGHWVWIQALGKVQTRDVQGRPLLMFGTHTDISARKALEERVYELSIRDPLTSLYNRRYIFDRLSEAMSEFARDGLLFALAILDVDHFKLVNDTYGHVAGDALLQSFASTLHKSLRPYDLLGRYGGEEFIIVSARSRKDQIGARIASILEEQRGRAMEHQGKSIRFTFSAGVCDTSEIGVRHSLEDFLRLADDRLYRAKKLGRDRVLLD